MSHAITVGDVVMVTGTITGIIAVIGLAILVIIVTDPFRSGH